MSCKLTTRAIPGCSLGAASAPSCGCDQHDQPLNININNNQTPFHGTMNMQPVVNTPPTVIMPQQQYIGGTVGGGRDHTIIEEPEIYHGRTEIIRRQPEIHRLPTERRVIEEEPTIMATTQPITRKAFFKKHYVPEFY